MVHTGSGIIGRHGSSRSHLKVVVGDMDEIVGRSLSIRRAHLTGVWSNSVQRVLRCPFLQFVLDRIEETCRVTTVKHAMVE